MPVIYLLEDDPSIRELVCYAVGSQSLAIRGFERPSAFWQALRAERPELILLDIMLPEEDGLSILRRLRAGSLWQDIPVIMLTARNTEFDRVCGLDNGADDFISKPFGVMELLARIRAVLRRAEKEKPPATCRVGELTLSPERRAVTVAGERVILTFKEFELLWLLMRNAGQVLPRSLLMARVWGEDFTGENRTLDVHIRTLRAKLGPAGELITTVRGVGYSIGEKP